MKPAKTPFLADLGVDYFSQGRAVTCGGTREEAFCLDRAGTLSIGTSSAILRLSTTYFQVTCYGGDLSFLVAMRAHGNLSFTT